LPIAQTPSYIKVTAATALRAESEAASEPSTSAWMVSAMHVRIRLFQEPQYQPWNEL